MSFQQQPEIEIYSLKGCPYCNRAKSFLKSKGFSYKEYNIGESKQKKQEMLERTDGAKTVPQIFVNDELIGGYDDLMAKKKSGELQQLLNLEQQQNIEKPRDLVIIGAGPGGLSAALYAARKGLDVLIISEAMGGQMVDTGEVGNYLGSSGVEGPELMQSFWEHVQEYDVKIVLGEKVEKIDKAGDSELYTQTESGKSICGRAIIITTGTKNRQLEVPGEEEFKGRGVHYCATCDGYLYSGRDVAVIGGGNAGLEAALDLAKLDCQVNLIEFQEQLTGDQILQKQVAECELINILTGFQVEEIVGNDKQDMVEQLVIKKRADDSIKKLSVDAVFVEIGLLPNTDFVSDLVDINDIGEIIINEANETSVKGIWAAGDVTEVKDKQIIVSAAEGARAALRVNEFLN